MKKILFPLWLLAAPLALTSQAQTPFTYQGKLENSGAAYTGTASIRLSLYAVSTSGSALKTETFGNITVTNGIFSVTPVSFVPSDFPGAARWIQIDVSSDGLTYTPMLPRQQVTQTPYAIHAGVADTATTVTGNVAASQINGFLNPSNFGSGTIAQTINFSPSSGPPFQVGNITKITNLNADLFDGLDSSSFLRTTGGVFSTGFSLNNATTTILSLDEAGLMRLKPNALGTRLTFGDNNYVSIGESATQDDTMILTGNRISISTINTTYPKGGFLDFGSNTRQMINLWNDTYGIGVQGNTEYFRTGNHFAWYLGGTHDDATLTPGGTGSTLMTLTSGGELDIKGTLCGYALLNRDDQAKRWEMYSRNSSGVDQLAFYSNTGGDVAAFSPNGNLYLVGELSTTVLTIRGGADVAEPFEMTEPSAMEPGSVVIIDEDHPGKLKLSSEPNDTKVAGIISGAGGVQPGLRLHQEGVLEGDHHVALSGRVYVKADASHGAIKPGDMLTTGDLPGYAMKVRDHEKAQGAILGKAMSKLDEGTGLVLVLVTLQ